LLGQVARQCGCFFGLDSGVQDARIGERLMEQLHVDKRISRAVAHSSGFPRSSFTHLMASPYRHQWLPPSHMRRALFIQPPATAEVRYAAAIKVVNLLRVLPHADVGIFRNASTGQNHILGGPVSLYAIATDSDLAALLDVAAGRFGLADVHAGLLGQWITAHPAPGIPPKDSTDAWRDALVMTDAGQYKCAAYYDICQKAAGGALSPAQCPW
jgi:hypothetical protein